MKSVTVLLVGLGVLFSSIAIAGLHNKSVGTKTVTSIINGKVAFKTETIAEPNPLPVEQSVLERERSKPLPLPQSINSAVRWTSNDGAAIANNVAVNPNGTNTFVGWYLNNERVSFHDNSSGTPLWEYPTEQNSGYYNFVAMSANANIVANGSYHNIYLFDKTSGTITFNFSIPDGRSAGPIAVSRDGQLLVCATVSPLAGGTHRVYAFNPPSTTPIWTFDFSDNQSTGVYGININANKTVVAVNGKFYGWILNANDGTVRTQLEIANTESHLALSADASVMGIAELSGFVKAYTWNGSQNRYDLLWLYRIPPGLFTNWAYSVDVSGDGLTLMAGSLIFVDGSTYDGNVYMFDTFGDGTPLWIRTGLGDEVSGVALSDDGSFGAATTWGDLNNPSKPTTFIFERGSNQPVYSVVSPGSMFAVSISADGKTVVSGGKHTHARMFGSGGDVYNVAVDLGGGAIAGTVLLGGVPPNHSGTVVQVVGTNRQAITGPAGNYLVTNVPAGTYSVRMSHLGYVGTTITNVTVSGTDTTRNVNASLAQSGAAPVNLVASHGQNSRIQLNWTSPPLSDDMTFDRLLATDPYVTTPSVPARRTNGTLLRLDPPLAPAFGTPVPDSIRIYRGVRTGGPYFLKRAIPGSLITYIDSTAIPLKDYYYRVTAVYGNGESAYSNEAFGTVDSSFLQFAITTPELTQSVTIDGTINTSEWNDALKVDVSDVFGYGGGVSLPRGSVFMWFKVDTVAKKLYIAGEDFLNNDGIAENEGFGLYFDDNHNRQFEPIGTDSLLREGNYWGYFFGTGSNVRFREIYTGGGVNATIDLVTDAQIAFSNSTGHLTGELSLPISFFNKNHLRVFGPNLTVGGGLFMIARNTSGGALFHGWWPQTMISVFTPSGFGDIHIPITLLAPPKPPSNVAVTRQGPFLNVTWTDPTQGINNEPLTVPVTLYLYRNGSPWRQLPLGVQSWTDSNVVARGWYEYKIRGSIDASASDNPNLTTYYGPFSQSVGTFAMSDPQLIEVLYDDGVPDVFFFVAYPYDGNQFAVKFTPQQYPAKVYRAKAFTNNGNSPILVEVHADSSGLPGPMLAGPYTGVTYQTAGVDSFLVTLPALDPPTIASGSFWVVLNYLPSSPLAPGIGGDYTQPIAGRSFYFTTTSGWVQIPNANLIVRAFITGQTSDVPNQGELPKVFALNQNYPNPFNPSTSITYELPSHSFVSLKMFDVLGREVATLVNEEKTAGKYSVAWNARDVSSGIYFYRLQAGSFTDTKKLILMK